MSLVQGMARTVATRWLLPLRNNLVTTLPDLSLTLVFIIFLQVAPHEREEGSCWFHCASVTTWRHLGSFILQAASDSPYVVSMWDWRGRREPTVNYNQNRPTVTTDRHSWVIFNPESIKDQNTKPASQHSSWLMIQILFICICNPCNKVSDGSVPRINIINQLMISFFFM